MKKENLPYIYIIIAGVLWGSIGVFVRIQASFGLSSMQIVVARFITVSAVFAAYIFIKDKRKFLIGKRDMFYFFLFGVGCFLVYNTAFALTTQITSLSVAVALLYTSPIWTMLLSIPIFHEKLTRSKGLAIFLSVFGVALISGLFMSGEVISWQGLVSGIASGIGYGGYSVFAKKLLLKYDVMTTVFYPFFFASLGGIMFCGAGEMGGIIIGSPIVLIYIVLGAVICYVIPFGLYTYSLNFTEASRAAVIVSIEPVSATILGLMLYSEPVTVTIVAGMLCIFAAIYVLNNKKMNMRLDGGR